MSFIPGHTPPESCHPPPRSTEPLSEKRPRQHHPAFGFEQGPGQRGGLAGRSHADADQGPKQVGGDREARTLRDVVHYRDKFQPAARAHHPSQEGREILPRAFDAGRHNAGGNDRGLEKAKVIFGEVKHFGERGDVCGCSQVDGGEAQDGLVDHAQPGADRRGRFVPPA